MQPSNVKTFSFSHTQTHQLYLLKFFITGAQILSYITNEETHFGSEHSAKQIHKPPSKIWSHVTACNQIFTPEYIYIFLDMLAQTKNKTKNNNFLNLLYKSQMQFFTHKFCALWLCTTNLSETWRKSDLCICRLRDGHCSDAWLRFPAKLRRNHAHFCMMKTSGNNTTAAEHPDVREVLGQSRLIAACSLDFLFNCWNVIHPPHDRHFLITKCS